MGVEEVELNYKSNCCSCLQSLSEGVQFTLMGSIDHSSDATSINLWSLMSFLVGIQISCNDSERICHQCEHRLRSAYEFKKQCLESLRILDRTSNNNRIKECDVDGVDTVPVIDTTKENYAIEENFKAKEQTIYPITDEQLTNNPNPNHRFKKLCPICGKLINSSRFHNHTQHHTNHRNHLCTQCGKGFKLREQLRRHLRIHTGEQKYKCDYCDEKFVHWASRRCHMRAVHILEKQYRCQICAAEFAHSSNMRRHMLYHTGDLRHQCAVCEKKFITSTELRDHLVVHTKERKEVCKICSKAFGTKKTLRTHLMSHTGEKKFGCSICGKSYSRPFTLKVHMKSHAPVLMDKQELKTC